MAGGLGGCIAGVKASFSFVSLLMLLINQVFLLHYAIQLHVTLVLFSDIRRVHGYATVASDSYTDRCGSTTGEYGQEGEDDH